MDELTTVFICVVAILLGLWLCGGFKSPKPPKRLFILTIIMVSLCSCEDNYEVPEVQLTGNAKQHCTMSD